MSFAIFAVTTIIVWTIWSIALYKFDENYGDKFPQITGACAGLLILLAPACGFLAASKL